MRFSPLSALSITSRFAVRLALRVVAYGLLLVLSACAGSGVRLATAPVHAYDVSGHWVVDASRSEDPDAAGSTSGGGRGMGGGHSHGGGMGGGGMGGMGGGGRHGGGAGAGSGAGDTSTAGGGRNGSDMRRAFLLPDHLDLAVQAGAVTITVDGRARSIPLVTPQDAHTSDPVRAGWDGDDLVIITHIDDKRGDVVQRFAVAADHSRLVVTTDMKGRSKKISVVREFTPAKA